MDIFDQLKQAISSHNACWDLLEAAEREVNEVLNATKARIDRDEAAHEKKIEDMTAQSKNPSRSAVLRELSARELEQMRERTFGPSEAETAAFYSSM